MQIQLALSRFPTLVSFLKRFLIVNYSIRTATNNDKPFTVKTKAAVPEQK